MKKIFLLLTAGLLFAMSVQAQKLGFINTADLMEAMPEYNKAIDELKAYQKTFQDQGQAMIKEYQSKIEAYQKEEATMTDVIKEIKQKEIGDLQNRLQDLNDSMGEKMDAKQKELMQPIMDKARKAIEAVGKENGYQYIYDAAGLLYAQDSDNVLPLVKAKLGLK
jgi:outer membrane protein